MSEFTVMWETLDLNNFRVFLRDLSASTDINLKHMIEDSVKQEKTQETISLSKKHKNKKKPQMKKKDLIIQENNKRLRRKEVDGDKQTIAFLLENLDDNNPYLNFERLKTEEAKTEYKLVLLERYWKQRKEYFNHVLILYFHLQDSKEEKPELFEKIDAIVDKYEVKGYMLEKLGDMLPPLNYWDKGSHTLDPWQLEVIGYVRDRESVIVKAPTSAGKTFVAMATGILHKRILYVCPAKPVAYQVGANFQKMGYRVHFLVSGVSDVGYDKQTNIFVGTPEIIEEYLPRLGNLQEFEYAVFDEIHTVNDYESGLCYENLIKVLRCPFLALSATVKNFEFLRSIFQRFHPRDHIHYVEYSKRFINQQRWIYSQSLAKIHPMRCYDGTHSLIDIHFSPNDCYTLYEALSDFGEDYYEEDGVLEHRIDALAPDEYFSGQTLLTLDESKEYERHLKQSIDELSTEYPQMIQDIKGFLTKDHGSVDALETMIPFFKRCRRKDLLPMLYFHTEETVSKEIFMKVYEDLQKSELEFYPFHYIILEKKQSYYQSYRDKRDTYESSIKIKTKDALSEKASRLDEFDKSEKQRYIHSVSETYEWAKKQCEKEDSEHKVSQLKNLERETQEFLKNPDFRPQDVFKKHPSYCFTNGEPMSGDEIRGIKRQIKNATGITIEYEDPLFQLLKRGIGLYLASLPDEYNWIVQRLLSQRKLGIVISDRTLCLGIDLPIRSVALTGYKNPEYTTSDYLQMSGRAGRRGKDKQGNIIFHGLSDETYVSLMKGTHPTVSGSDKPMYESYNVITSLNHTVDLENVYDKRLHKNILPIQASTVTYEDTRFMKLVWHLRYYQKGQSFVDSLLKIEKKLFRESEEDRGTYLLQHISDNLLTISEDVMKCYKRNKIDEDLEPTLQRLRALGDICRYMANTLNQVTYRITLKVCRDIFERCRTLVYKYRLV